MTTNLTVDRLYSLGDYKNIRFASVVNEVPEEIARNPKAVELLFFQQTLACEIAYRKYVDIVNYITENLSTVRGGKTVVDAEAAMAYLLEQRQITFNELYEEIKNTQKETE